MASLRTLRSRLALAFPLLACTALPLSAQAQTVEKVDLDGTALNLVVPEGYCKLDRATKLGQAFYEMQERLQRGTNRVLLLFADCAELKAAVANPRKTFSHHGSYLTPSRDGRGSKLPANLSRKQVVDEIAKTVPKVDEKAMTGQLNARTKSEGIAVDKVQMGLLERDDTALYVAIAANATPSGSKAERFRGVIFMTALGGYPVSSNLYSPVEPGAPFDKLLAQQKKNALAVIKAN